MRALTADECSRRVSVGPESSHGVGPEHPHNACQADHLDDFAPVALKAGPQEPHRASVFVRLYLVDAPQLVKTSEATPAVVAEALKARGRPRGPFYMGHME